MIKQASYDNNNLLCCLQVAYDTCYLTDDVPSVMIVAVLKDIYFVIYGIISDFTDKGQFQYLTNLNRPQEGTYLYTTQNLTLR